VRWRASRDRRTRMRIARRLLSASIALAVLAGCQGGQRAITVYSDLQAPLVVRLRAGGTTVDRRLGIDAIGYLHVGDALPGGATIAFLDGETCEVIGTTQGWPASARVYLQGNAQLTQFTARFSPADNVVDSPSLLPETADCQGS
jgi:hypothetical protein